MGRARVRWIAGGIVVSMLLPAVAAARREAPRPRPTSAALDAAHVDDGDLPVPVNAASQPAAILRAQVHLDRAGFSVGEIDARWGANLARAVTGFQKAHDLPPTGVVDAATWAALEPGAPTLVAYVVTPEDAAGPFTPIPTDMMEKAKLPALSYGSLREALAERAHASEALLAALNPGAAFSGAGETLMVPNTAVGPPTPAASIEVDASDLAVRVRDDAGRVIARYPASVGSEHDPLPIGEFTIRGVSRNPPFHYNPRLFWDAKSSHTAATIAPGPNNPVGVVWIDLSKEHYGIHGTPEPSRISRTESHGCIRLTNWDAIRLAEQVHSGTPATLIR
jgi:lipoprotein-anchoring transpeptidase ErfK/SrfK